MDATDTVSAVETVKVTSKVGHKVYLVIKRFMDILFSLIGLIFLLPVALIVKIVYMCNKDFHPIFFKQQRIGKNGKLEHNYPGRTAGKHAVHTLLAAAGRYDGTVCLQLSRTDALGL